ncbi:MAG: TRAP transporter substrate-binding protein [Spirochaetota bacterium]
MKKYILLLMSLFVLIPVLVGKGSGESGVKTIRIGHDSQENAALHQAFLYFKEKVENKSELNLKIEIYPAAQLGGAKELFDTVQQGNLEMTAPATVLLSPDIPQFNVLDKFYLFDSVEHAHKALDGPAGQKLLEVLGPLGIHGLGYMEVGMRSMSNSRNPIDELSALKGLKIRAASNPLQIAAWKSAGAAPIPMAWGEIFTSLQQGLLDGQESAISSMYTQRFFEAQKYISLTEHIYTNYLWVVNKNFWESLTSEQQMALNAIGQDTIAEQRRLAKKFNAEYLDKIVAEGGLEVNEVSSAFKAALSEKLNGPIDAEVKNLTGAELYNFVMEEVDQVR